jgi:hypothetical protein
VSLVVLCDIVFKTVFVFPDLVTARRATAGVSGRFFLALALSLCVCCSVVGRGGGVGTLYVDGLCPGLGDSVFG